MNQFTYDELLQSLAENASAIMAHGVDVEVRNCADRIQGQMDPRTAKAACATRESFRADKASFDTQLCCNEEKLFGPEHPECYKDAVAMMRCQFGWSSLDKSSGVAVKCVQLQNDDGKFTLWQYRANQNQKNRPCLIFIHGGGFVAGNTATVENQCKLIAQASEGVVISVDYPLAPENKFPIGFNACYDTVKWAYENADDLGIAKEKIGVAGDSAGGNYALACTLRDRDEKAGRIHYQALIYPLLSRSFSAADPYYYWNEALYENPQNNPVIAGQIRLIGTLARQGCAWYLSEETDRFNPYISPITAGGAGLPKTLLMTAEYDFLRAECDAYFAMLKKADVDVRAIRYGGIFHGTFDRLGYAPQVEDMVLEIAKDMKRL